MNRKKIYNPTSTEHVNERQIFGGNPTGIFELNNIKYQWAYNLWEMMLNNTWFPKEVDMTRDTVDYKNLTEMEKTALKKGQSPPNKREIFFLIEIGHDGYQKIRLFTLISKM